MDFQGGSKPSLQNCAINSAGRENNYPGHWLSSYFLRNKTFLFVKIDSRNFKHLFDFRFHETSQNQLIQTINRKNGNTSCLNSLKFFEVSQNLKLDRC